MRDREREIAWVTGGRHGLGYFIAEELASVGMKVISPGSSELDVRSGEEVKKYWDKEISTEGVDLLVCNAGVTADGPLMRMSESDWDRVLDVNLKGAFLCAREAARVMVKRRSGHILFISSYSAEHPPAGQANYAAAKSALLGMMKSLAQELGGKNIRVNAVFPGFLETTMTEKLSDEIKRTNRERHVLKRFNTPQHVGKFIVFLHRQMPHTSGQVFNLDSRVL